MKGVKRSFAKNSARKTEFRTGAFFRPCLLRHFKTDQYLHIGQGKTGTRYIQNALVLSQSELAKHDIADPVPKRDLNRVRRNQGRISSGNGASLLDPGGDLEQSIPAAAEKPLFSSELLSERIAADAGARDRLKQTVGHFDRVKALPFVREPIEFAVSAYQQMVKRHGHFGPLRDYVMATDHLDKLSVCLDFVTRTPGIEPTIRTYSKRKKTVVEIVKTWLAIPAGCLRRPARSRVNRGLSRDEPAVQRHLNRRPGPSGNLFADRVTQLFPDRSIAPIQPAPDLRRDFFEKFRSEIADINARLPASESLETARVPMSGQ